MVCLISYSCAKEKLENQYHSPQYRMDPSVQNFSSVATKLFFLPMPGLLDIIGSIQQNTIPVPKKQIILSLWRI